MTTENTKVLLQLKNYCAYQERSHQELRTKLYSLGVRQEESESFIAQLIEEGFLNEERFARQFALGKFRIRQWGRRKIVQALKQKQVSDYCIRKGLEAIDDSDYRLCLRKLAAKKKSTLRSEKNQLIRKRKIMDFLLQKGYEHGLINECLREIES